VEIGPGSRIGTYVIQERIGRGGSGTVYRAFHPGLERYAAIKILPERFANDPVFLQRFQREARIIASLRHPSILAVYDFGDQDGLAFIITEYVGGGTLRDLLGAPIPLQRVVTLATPLANALDYAHNHGVLHRDIKPANILLREDGKAVLADFGLANIIAAGSHLTPSGAVVGTPQYLSPEHAGSDQMDARADVYSFGIMLYEMLTGTVPFDEESPTATIVAHLYQPCPSPLSRNPDLLPQVEPVLLKALEKDPANRYNRAGELVRGLRAAMADAMLGKDAAPREERSTTIQIVRPAVDALPSAPPAVPAAPVPAPLPSYVSAAPAPSSPPPVPAAPPLPAPPPVAFTPPPSVPSVPPAPPVPPSAAAPPIPRSSRRWLYWVIGGAVAGTCFGAIAGTIVLLALTLR
jgi:serine/threonine-protein kinase